MKEVPVTTGVVGVVGAERKMVFYKISRQRLHVTSLSNLRLRGWLRQER